MSRIDFYHLQKQNLEDVLPKLLEKAYSSGAHINVKVGTEARVDFLNSLLWTYNDESFLPHGSKKDGAAELQPIWLSSDDDNPNNAAMLFLTDDAAPAEGDTEKYTRIFNIFDGNNPEALQTRANCGKVYVNQAPSCIIGSRTMTAGGPKKLNRCNILYKYRKKNLLTAK